MHTVSAESTYDPGGPILLPVGLLGAIVATTSPVTIPYVAVALLGLGFLTARWSADAMIRSVGVLLIGFGNCIGSGYSIVFV